MPEDKEPLFPVGQDARSIRAIAAHYDQQADDAALMEDECARRGRRRANDSGPQRLSEMTAAIMMPWIIDEVFRGIPYPEDEGPAEEGS